MKRSTAARLDDSDFDWDFAGERSAQTDQPNAPAETALAWIVLVVLTFCPFLGFLLASVWPH